MAKATREYVYGINPAFEVLRARLDAYKPDLLVMVGGDQTEMFDRSNVPNDDGWYDDVLRGRPGIV